MLGVGCVQPPERRELPPAAVVTATPIVMPIVEWDSYVGRLEPVEFVEVRARVSGYLATTHFSEGQVVQAGDLLAVIDPRPFVADVNRAAADVAQATARIAQSEAAAVQAGAEVESAQARADLALKTVERWRALVAKNAAPQEDLDTREAELLQAQAAVAAAEAAQTAAKADTVTANASRDTAEAQLEIARLTLSYTEVRAPVSGRVSRRYVTEGNLISGGSAQSTLLTTIVSLNPIHCMFDADEQAFLRYVRLAQSGARKSSREHRNPVYLALADETGGYPHVGHMDFVDNRLDQATGTIRGRAIFRNDDLSLTPGLFARLRLPGTAQYEAILIPDRAVGTDQSEKFVLVVEEGNKVRRQVVELGGLSHGLRIIRKGLAGTETIIIKGQQRVRPGDVVAPTNEPITAEPQDLPDVYEPIPQEEWIVPAKAPAANLESRSTLDPINNRETAPAAAPTPESDPPAASDPAAPVGETRP
jgi:RND family efflux transporter MFP subunit